MSRRLDVVIFVVALLASLLAHVVLLEGLGTAARRAPRQHRTVEMALVVPPPPVVEPPPAPPPKPVDLTQKKPRAPKVEVPPPSNTTEAPPVETAKEPPKPVFGISMSSVVGPGQGSGFTVRAGNTLMKDPEKEYTPPTEVQAYAKPVSLHEVSKMPVRQGECRGDYPAAAKAQGIEGSVKLEVEVQSDGTVGDVRVVSGLGHGLDEAAVAALKACRFEPAEVAGKVVTTRIVYTYIFLIED